MAGNHIYCESKSGISRDNNGRLNNYVELTLNCRGRGLRCATYAVRLNASSSKRSNSKGLGEARRCV